MRNYLLAIFATALLTLASCQSKEEYMGEVSAILNLSSTENNVWRINGSRAATATMDFYYVLNGNSICQTASRTNHSESGSFEKFLALGSYNVFCITNADPSGIRFEQSMIGADCSSQAMVLNTLTDVCLGYQPVDIVASKTNYDINVSVNHILAKLALSISKVPADVETITLTLGNVSKTFYLDGTFAKSDTTQVLSLQKATSANADGTYDWTLSESLIYPCQTDASATVITIVATDTKGNATTYETSAETVCSSGTRTSLTTTWRTLINHLSYSYTESPWTEHVQEGSFDM